MRGAFLRTFRVTAGLSAADVAREASLSARAVRRAEAAGVVRPHVALQYLLAVERYLQRRCEIMGTVRGLLYEADDLMTQELRAAEGEVLPLRRLPRLSEIVAIGNDLVTAGPWPEVVVDTEGRAVEIARRAARRQRFLALWRTRLETRERGRPPGHDPSSMPRLEVMRVRRDRREGPSPRDVWMVTLRVAPPPGYTGYWLLSGPVVEIEAATGRVVQVSMWR